MSAGSTVQLFYLHTNSDSLDMIDMYSIPQSRSSAGKMVCSLLDARRPSHFSPLHDEEPFFVCLTAQIFNVTLAPIQLFANLLLALDVLSPKRVSNGD